MPKSRQAKPRRWQKNLKMHERTVDRSKFYNSRKWRNFSIGYKLRHPLCIDCKEAGIIAPTTVTDHIEQASIKGAGGWDLDSLNDKDFEPRCEKHHNARSGKQAHGKGKRK